MRRLAVAPTHRRLLERLLDILQEDGWFAGAGGSKRVPTGEELRSELDRLQRAYPQAANELALLARTSQHLADVLRGDASPNDVLFPDGDTTLLARLYRDSPSAAMMNALVERAVTTSIAAWPADRPLRILEIGAGTGATTARLLPHLSAHRTDYVFSDVSDVFTAKAAETLHAHPFVRFALLDIDRDPAEQGFDTQPFDIVIAANAFHATAKLGRTLQHVGKLMAPGALLVLVEGTGPSRLLDLTFGLTEGWWRFGKDPSRGSHCLITTAQWQALLEAHRFDGICHAASSDVGGLTLPPQAVITARAPGADATPRHDRAGHWLIFADRGGVGAQVSRMLRQHGAETTMIGWSPDAPDSQLRIAPDRPADYRRVVAQALSKGSPLRGVVHLWSLDARLRESSGNDTLREEIALGSRSALYLAQALADAQLQDLAQLCVVTRGAMSAAAGRDLVPDSPDGLAQAPVWGLGKVLASEHAELHCRLIDLDPAGGPQAAMLFDDVWFGADAGETRVALRSGRRHVARLVESRAAPRSFRPRVDRSYLITGGFGGIGMRVAGWLVARGARHLVLVGRGGAAPASADTIRGFTQAGVQVVAARADVSDADELAVVLADAAKRLPPLAGVIHAAGVFADRLVANHEWSLFEEVFAAKVHGAWNLHRLTRDLPLDFFALFSSATTLLCGAGLANYVAANEFLDALASYRRSIGLPGLSIAWGPWDDLGMATRVGATREAEWQAVGMRSLPPVDALQALSRVLSGEAAQVAVMSVDWARFRRHPSSAALGRFIALLAPGRQPAAERRAALRRGIEHAPRGERRHLLLSHVRTEVEAVLGWDHAEPINLRHGFFDLGMDSLQANELRNRLQSSLECTLPPTLTFKFPTIAALTDHLAGVIFTDADDGRADDGRADQSREGATPTDESIPDIDVQLGIGRELAQLEKLLGGE